MVDQSTPGLVSNAHKSKKEGKYQESINQAPHLTQDTNGKVTISQLDVRNESQAVSPFTAGDHKASTNRRALNPIASKLTVPNSTVIP